MRSFSSLSSPFALISVRQRHSDVRAEQGTATHGLAHPLQNSDSVRAAATAGHKSVPAAVLPPARHPYEVGSSTPTLGVRHYRLNPDTQLREPKPGATSEVWVFLGHRGRVSGDRSGMASHLSQITERGERHRLPAEKAPGPCERGHP